MKITDMLDGIDKQEAFEIAVPILKTILEKLVSEYLDDLARFLAKKIIDSENKFDDILLPLLKKLS